MDGETMDPRLSDAVAAANVRAFLAGALKEPAAGTLAAEVREWELAMHATGFKEGRRFGRDAVLGEIRTAAQSALLDVHRALAEFQNMLKRAK